MSAPPQPCECGHDKQAHRQGVCWATHCHCVTFRPDYHAHRQRGS